MADHKIFGKIKALELAWSRMNDATMAALRAQLPECEFWACLAICRGMRNPCMPILSPDAPR